MTSHRSYTELSDFSNMHRLRDRKSKRHHPLHHATAHTFCWRHSLQARFTGCRLLSSRSLSSPSSILPGELSIPAMVTLRLRLDTPSAAPIEAEVWLTPVITGLVAAESLSIVAIDSGAWVCDPPIPLDRPKDARLMTLVRAGSRRRGTAGRIVDRRI